MASKTETGNINHDHGKCNASYSLVKIEEGYTLTNQVWGEPQHFLPTNIQGWFSFPVFLSDLRVNILFCAFCFFLEFPFYEMAQEETTADNLSLNNYWAILKIGSKQDMLFTRK